MTATMTQLRMVNCYTCGRPTGQETADGQSEWPVCRPCENLRAVYGEHRHNIPGDLSTLYCYSPHDRDNYIHRNGNGIIPQHPDQAVEQQGEWGHAEEVEDEEPHEEVEPYCCPGCGSARFRYIEVERRYQVTDGWELEEDYRDRDEAVVWNDDTEYDDTLESYVECDNCGRSITNYQVV